MEMVFLVKVSIHLFGFTFEAVIERERIKKYYNDNYKLV